MAGVVGWWDETSEPEVSDALDELIAAGAQDVDKAGDGDKSPFHDLDEKVLSQLKEGGVTQHQKDLEDVEPVKNSQVTQAMQKVMSTPWMGTTGTITLTGISPNTTTYHLDYVNLTGQAHRRFQEYQAAFEKVTAALDQLTPKLLGLPSKEYKGIKKDLELVARIMVEAQEKGLR